jgi:peptidoglycan hydrolase-like protein with peptidoglycan-binding domain
MATLVGGRGGAADRGASDNRRMRAIVIGACAACIVLALAIAAVVLLATVGLDGDPEGLAQVQLGALGGTLRSATVSAAGAKPVRLVRSGDVLTPAKPLAAGERVVVDVTVKRPGAIAWALGSQVRKRVTLTTPTAVVGSRWNDVAADGSVRIPFAGTVSRVRYIVRHQTSERRFATPVGSISLGRPGPAGTASIAVAARRWERLGRPTTVDWFPRAGAPVAIVSPKPSGQRGPADPIRLTFSVPVREALGSAKPKLAPATPGRWTQPDSHTLLFTPSGYGAGFGVKVALELPRAVDVTGADGTRITRTSKVSWISQPGSTLRLQQLLAQAGYLPLDWTASGTPVALTRAAQSRAASTAPAGSFAWRYDNTPGELKKLWTPGRIDTITRGAVMMFQDDHHLTVDAIAGAGVWKALLDDTIAGRRRSKGYSYVYVHRDVPQRLHLWHNGRTVLTSPGNTGVPAAPTELGTFPVFEHVASTTMSGTNPDGSTYNDPGVKWVSYFNGGDALHAFNRASFGTPQSLGCVELPLATAARVWPYTPIGTLVTVEH